MAVYTGLQRHPEQFGKSDGGDRDQSRERRRVGSVTVGISVGVAVTAGG